MSKGPSAWRLNKTEQSSVNRDLEEWEAKQSDSLGEEELARLKEEEKKRLTRVIQEVKHKKSLEKQGAAAAKVKAKAKAAPASGGPPLPLEPSSGANNAYFQKLADDLQLIYETLGDLKNEKPVPIKDGPGGGVQEPYNSSDCKKALGSQGYYISAANLMWFDLFRVASPDVPLSVERTSDLANFLFQGKVDHCRVLFDVAVAEKERTDVPGGLKLISPEEVAHAVVMACASRLRSKDCRAEEKEQWRCTLFPANTY